MKVHRAADLFPMMTDAEMAALVESIVENGLRDPIRLLDGEILDGRNRALACERAGVEPRFEDVETDDPVAYVVDVNAARRVLARDQRALVAASAWEMYEVPTGGAAQVESARTEPTRTRERLARIFGVGVTAIQRARKLLAEWPEAAERVRLGEVDLDACYETLRQQQRTKDDARREIERLRRLVESDDTPPTDFLPPPSSDEVEAVRITPREFADSLGEAPKDTRETADAAKKWLTALRAIRVATEGLNALPDFPADAVDAGAIQAASVMAVERLGDSAARLVAKLPTEKTKRLRRVQ